MQQNEMKAYLISTKIQYSNSSSIMQHNTIAEVQINDFYNKTNSLVATGFRDTLILTKLCSIRVESFNNELLRAELYLFIY